MSISIGMVGKFVILIMLVVIMAGCFAGQESRWKTPPKIPPQPEPAGFWAGLWHGIIAVFALIFEIFSDIRIYETNNTGWWYDFGFLLGVGAFSSGGIKIIRKK